MAPLGPAGGLTGAWSRLPGVGRFEEKDALMLALGALDMYPQYRR